MHRFLVVAAAVTFASAGMLFARQQPPPPAAGSQTAPAPAPGRGAGRVQPAPVDFGNTAGWTSLFDGRTLNGWDGNPEVWKIEDGAITAESTMERRVGLTYIIWKGGEPSDFELKLEVRMLGTGLHSGIAYRSWIDPDLSGLRSAGPGRGAGAPGAVAGGGGAPAGARGAGGGRAAVPPPAIPSDPRWNLSGYGLDYDYGTQFNGNVEERGTVRGEIAYRGGVVQTETGKRPQYLGLIGDPDALAKVMKPDDWNQLHIIARRNQLTHIINGQVMTVLIDDDATFAKSKGLIGWQVDGIGKISVRNIWLKTY